MKKKLGTLLGKPIVEADENLLRKQEIKLLGIVDMTEKSQGSGNDVIGLYFSTETVHIPKIYYNITTDELIYDDCEFGSIKNFLVYEDFPIKYTLVIEGQAKPIKKVIVCEYIDNHFITTWRPVIFTSNELLYYFTGNTQSPYQLNTIIYEEDSLRSPNINFDGVHITDIPSTRYVHNNGTLSKGIFWGCFKVKEDYYLIILKNYINQN